MYENNMEYSGYDPLVTDGNIGDLKSADEVAEELQGTSWFSGDVANLESLDFDEVESVMWRKVIYYYLCLVKTLTNYLLASIASFLPRSWTLVDIRTSNYRLEMDIGGIDRISDWMLWCNCASIH
jgi:hypothetical protein